MEVMIYTDGACKNNPGPGGWASIFIKDNNITFETKGGKYETTNNQMELKAVIESVRQILEIEKISISKQNYTIYSDSAYVINAITKGWLKNWRENEWLTASGDEVKNKEMWVQFYEFAKSIKRRKISLKFKKVKGHSGDIYNETVDKIAVAEAAKIKLKFNGSKVINNEVHE